MHTNDKWAYDEQEERAQRLWADELAQYRFGEVTPIGLVVDRLVEAVNRLYPPEQ